MQTAHSDEWRPGFAKRADNFSSVCATAETWRWRPGESIARVAAAVLKGTPSLSIPQRMTLLLYVEHLNQERLEQDIASVWPSTGLVAEYLGCSQSQARANRKALEAAGFMVRDYTRANRPAGVEAYDLRPLMARLEELEAVDEAIRERIAARRAAYSETIAFPTKYSAQAPKSRHLEQSHENYSFSVRENDAASPRTKPVKRSSTRPENGKENGQSSRPTKNSDDSAKSSSERANGLGSGSSAPSVYAEMVRQELQTAVKVCPRLAPLVRDEVLQNPTTATPEDAARIAAAAAELLPEPERNNDQTAIWGWRKHGIRILVMLAIVLEDPEIRSPCGYFGKLTGQDRGAADLRLNLARILRLQGQIPPIEAMALTPADDPPAAVGDAPSAAPVKPPPDMPELMFRPGVDDPRWQAIEIELRRLLRQGVYDSWFGRIGFHGLADGALHISAPTPLTADRLKAEYRQAFLDAAEAADIFVERVVITVRKL
jgi:hypothetical protein